MLSKDEKRRIWGWWFFDWASQPFATLILTFVFSVYFAEVARGYFTAHGLAEAQAGAKAQALWSWTLTVVGLFIAALAPVLGALADGSGRRMAWIWFFSGLYVIGSLGLWCLTPQQPPLFLALGFFGIGMIGMEFATIFTNALLPDLTKGDDLGRVSGSGFAFGYLGGIVALALMLAFFVESPSGLTYLGRAPAFGLDPALREGTRFAGPFTAVWYIVFMLPFFLWVKEAPRAGGPVRIGPALAQLGVTIKSLRHRQSLAAWLLSSMLSRDALNALYGLGGVFAGGVLGWSVMQAGVFGVVSAIAAALVSWLGGKADRRFGPKPVIVLCSYALIGVCAVVVGLTPEAFYGLSLAPGMADVMFYICGGVIGGAGGALQSASRTMMVRHTTPDRATEAFGLYALSGKATAFLAPAAISIATVLSGRQGVGVSPLIVIFLLSLVLLKWVNPRGEV